ncbi:MAG: hypothetical protein CVV44_08505 [Spirochaetae bacterium HGW-Spirochaetae-1]|nr:MAG: hypothetical protein CVV44_08505 [Spirochaetae bacterium HGW-Spirochaetae-1]
MIFMDTQKFPIYQKGELSNMLIRFRIITVFLLMIVLHVFPCQILYAATPITLQHDQESYELWDHIDINVDPDGNLGPETLSRVHWEKNIRKVIQYGLTGYTYWMRFTVNNTAGIDSEYYLDTNDTQTEIVELYLATGTSWKLLKQAGRFHPDSFKLWNRPDIPFVPPRGTTTYYLKAASQSYINFEPVLRTPTNYLKKISRYLFLYGAYFSIIVVMILYNTLLFIGMKSKTYAFYVLYLISILGHQFFGEGFGVMFFGAGYLPLYSGITFIAACLFTDSYFENRRNHPLIHRAGIWLMVALGVWSAGSLFIHPQRYAYFITSSIVSTVVYTYVILNCAAAIKAGNKTASFFILGWSGLIIFSAMYLGVIFQIIPANGFTLNGIGIGSVYEAVMLSLALAQQVNISRQEREEAIQRNLDTQTRMAESFARFVPKEFIQFLGRQSIIDIQLGDQIQRTITILFSDIRSFTTFSEKNTPQETIDFLNSYFVSIGPIIRKNRGFVDKYIGDAIMALFPGNPDDAIDAAEEMMHQLDKFNADRTISNRETIRIGIGIHTGECMLGTIGEKDRLETTVIADAVNTASRLEGLNKRFNTTILISQKTLASLKNPGKYHVRDLGLQQVRGKTDKLHIHEIIQQHAQHV